MTEQQWLDIINQEQNKQEIYIWKKDALELSKWIWNLAIETASEHGECNCNVLVDYGPVKEEDIECALNKNSILKLKL